MNTLRFQFALAARYLLGRKLRTALTTLAIVFGVTVFFGLSLLVPAMSDAYRRNLLMSTGQVDLTVTHVTGGTFGRPVLDAVRATDGVASATGLLRRSVLLPASSGWPAVSVVVVVGLDPTTAQGVRSYPLASGRFLAEGDTSAMVVPVTLASKVGVKVGDTATLPAASGAVHLQVVGIVSTQPAAGAEEVYVSLPAAQVLLNQPDQINVVEALFAPGSDRDRVNGAVKGRLGEGYRLGALQAGGELEAGLQTAGVIYGAFGLMSLVMGAFIIYNTFRTVVAERRHDLGMLRAVGASRRMVLGMTLAEGLVQGLTGTAIGLVAGYAMAAGFMGWLSNLMRGIVPMEARWPVPTLASIILAVLLGVGITIGGALLPALSATRVTPLEALRPALERAAGWRVGRGPIAGFLLIGLAAAGLASGQIGLVAGGAVLFLGGLILVTPALVRPIARLFGQLLELAFAQEGQIAEGNMARQPGRAAITASTMTIGLAIGIGLLGLISSTMGAFSGYLDRSLGARFLVMPSSLVLGSGIVGAGPELAQRLREIPGVGPLSTLRLASSEAQGSTLQVVGIDPATFPAVSGLAFSQGEPAEAYAALGRERAIVLNALSALQLRARVGDTITIRTPEGDQPYRVAGVGTDYLNAKLTTGYISQANLARDFHQTVDLLLMANPAPAADVAAVRRGVDRVVGEYPAFSVADAETFRESQMRIFAGAQRSLYVMLFAVALPGLIAMVNTLAINVMERRREIGMLRAVGSTRPQVERMILGESLLLAGMGTALGILAGLWLGFGLTKAATATGYTVAYAFPLASVLACIAVGLLFGVLAGLLPARQAARLPIVAALRYE